jgi:hypothetical protein
MRTYIPSPSIDRTDDTIPFVTVRTADQVCATEAYTISFFSNSRYVAVLSMYLTDDEMDFLTEAIAAARAERLASQEAAYEVLQAKFGSEWDNRRIPTDEEDAREYDEVVRLEVGDDL